MGVSRQQGIRGDPRTQFRDFSLKKSNLKGQTIVALAHTTGLSFLKDYKRCFNSHHQVLIFSVLYSPPALQNAGLGRLISIGKTTLKHCIEQDIRGARVYTYFYEGPDSKYFSHMISDITARVCHFSALNQSWLCCAQSCPTLCDPMGCGPPGSSVHGDSPGKNTDAMPSFRESSQPRDRN